MCLVVMACAFVDHMDVCGTERMGGEAVTVEEQPRSLLILGACGDHHWQNLEYVTIRIHGLNPCVTQRNRMLIFDKGVTICFDIIQVK